MNGRPNRSVGFATGLDCIACLVRQALEATALATQDRDLCETTFRRALRFLTAAEWHREPPAVAQRLHRLIRDATDNPNPYAAVKLKLTQFATRLEPIGYRRLSRKYTRFEAAVRLAILGNLLEVGAKTQLGEDDVLSAFDQALRTPVVGFIAELAGAINGAKEILFLADNAGRIVFDRQLLAELPLGRLTVVVRGMPVLNDATVADAEAAGLGDFCGVIANGSDAPGTLLEDCSPEFRRRFNEADLVIAKGQGNCESLAGCRKHVFFLFKAKCSTVAQAIGWPMGSLVIRHQLPHAVRAGLTMPLEILWSAGRSSPVSRPPSASNLTSPSRTDSQ